MEFKKQPTHSNVLGWVGKSKQATNSSKLVSVTVSTTRSDYKRDTKVHFMRPLASLDATYYELTFFYVAKL